MINWRTVDSSNIAAIGWPTSFMKNLKEPLPGLDVVPDLMFVRFHSGGVYAYEGVSRQRAVALAYRVQLYGESIGEYLNKVIKPNFSVMRISDAA